MLEIASDLHAYDGADPRIQTGIDVFTHPPHGPGHIVTNPPYLQAVEMIQHMLHAAPGAWVIVILRSSQAHIKPMRKLMAWHRFYGLAPLPFRPKWFEGKVSPRHDFSWFFWRPVHFAKNPAEAAAVTKLEDERDYGNWHLPWRSREIWERVIDLGETQAAVGKRFGISGNRVRQIVQKQWRMIRYETWKYSRDSMLQFDYDLATMRRGHRRIGCTTLEEFMPKQHEGLPVEGYRPQPQNAIDTVNEHKVIEERLLRRLDQMMSKGGHVYDGRWLAIAKNHFEQGFMALNRAVFKPGRVKLVEDVDAGGMPHAGSIPDAGSMPHAAPDQP